MPTYRFVGTTATLHRNGKSIDLNYFGQTVELAIDEAKHEALNRIALLPQADFNSCGFTSDELGRYATAAEIRSAPATFLKKVEDARNKFVANLFAPAAPVVVEPAAVKPAPVVPSTPEVKPTNG